MADDEDYEATRKRLVPRNRKLIEAFVGHCAGSMGGKRVQTYAECLTFFADEYLLNYIAVDLNEGIDSMAEFVGDWFIRKCMWSDAGSVDLNLQAFDAYLGYLAETGQQTEEPVGPLRQELKDRRDLFLMRARCYNDPALEPEDFMDEYGGWNDDEVRRLCGAPAPAPDASSSGLLRLNILFSARAAKFFKLKPPHLVKLQDAGFSWGDPAHRWVANWRCEECFGMKGSKERVFIVTNECTRYSFLLRLAPGDVDGVFFRLRDKVLAALRRHGVGIPENLRLEIMTLAGAARSLAGVQMQMIYHLGHMLERKDHPYLDDYEGPLNRMVTTIDGRYGFPDQQFERFCIEEPPFERRDPGGDKIIPFVN